MNLQLVPYGVVTVVFRHKAAVAAIFLTVLGIGVAYLMLVTPRYQSVAQLIVRFGDRSIPEVDRKPATEMTPSDRREVVLANAHILGSHDLEEATIKAIGLDKIYPDIVTDPPARWSPMDEAVQTFDKDLAVDVGAIDNVITVSFLHPDKQLVPKILHELISLYVARQTTVYQNPQSTFLAGEVKSAGVRLDSSQQALQQFKAKWRITDYDQEVQDLLKQRGDVDTNLQTARSNLIQAQKRKADIAEMLKDIPKTVPAPPSGERYRSIDDALARLGELQAKRSQMMATYRANSPALAALNAGIAQIQAELRSRERESKTRGLSNANPVHQTVQTDYVRASADVEGYAGPVRILEAQLKGIDQRLQALQQNRGTYDDLLRQTQIDEATFKTLSAQYEDARVKDNLNERRISPVTIISQPTLPYRTARPRKLITLAACLFAATILSLGTALTLEALDDRFTTAAQVAYALDLPVLAAFEQQRMPSPTILLPGRGLS